MRTRTRSALVALAALAWAGAARAQPATPTIAAPEGWTVGVAPSLGVTVPTSKLGATIVGGVELSYALPVLSRRLLVSADLTLTRPGHDGSGSDPRVGGAYDFSIRERELKLGLGAIYRLWTGERRLVPYAGLGPVLHLLETTEEPGFGAGASTEQDSQLGFELLGGVDYRLGPGLLLGEARLVYTDLDHLLTGESNAGNVILASGYRLIF